MDTDNDYICGYNSSYYCIDPAYSEETVPSNLCRPERSGNGLCDDRNNNPECGTECILDLLKNSYDPFVSIGVILLG